MKDGDIMDIVVQKYGGSSIKDKDAMEYILKRTKKYLQDDFKLVIVVSAQGKTTDSLINISKEYSNTQDKKALDLLLATGEMCSAALLSLMLNDNNIKSIALTGWQAGIITDSNHGEAKIQNIYKEHILNKLKDYSVVIVTGFQGIDKLGNITTLGRGGSDLSATAIASVLDAKLCEIYSDIDGILSCDPKIISDAKLLKDISYDEMIEAASCGAKVMHNRSVLVAKEYNTKVEVKNSRNLDTNSKGSYIMNIENKDIIENNEIKIISKKDNLSKITLVGQMMMSNISITKEIYDIARELNTQIFMISFSELSLSIIVDTDISNEFLKLLHKKLIVEPK